MQVCRCAEESIARKVQHFGLHWWGECWAMDDWINDGKVSFTGSECYVAGMKNERCDEEYYGKNDVDCTSNINYFVYKVEL